MKSHGRARVSARNPKAFAICDRCGFLYNHVNLRWQFDWAGATLLNKRILVCQTCEDRPQEQLRAFVIPADPVPIQNPRTQNYSAASVDERVTQSGDVRVTQTDANRVPQQTGEPPGGLNETPGTDPNAPGNSSPGLPYGNTTVPETGPL